MTRVFLFSLHVWNPKFKLHTSRPSSIKKFLLFTNISHSFSACVPCKFATCENCCTVWWCSAEHFYGNNLWAFLFGSIWRFKKKLYERLEHKKIWPWNVAICFSLLVPSRLLDFFYHCFSWHMMCNIEWIQRVHSAFHFHACVCWRWEKTVVERKSSLSFTYSRLFLLMKLVWCGSDIVEKVM